MSGNKLVAFGCVLTLMGCHDPMSTLDGISPAAGLAQRHNVHVHAASLYGGGDPGANPGGSGPRAAEVIGRYEAGVDQAGAQASGGEAGALAE